MNKIRLYREGDFLSRYFFSFLPRLTVAACYVVIVASCNQKPSENISLFNGSSFQLKANERTVNLRPEDRDYFDGLTGDTNVQIPLFRRIEAPTHSLFIGLPVGTSFAELIKTNTDEEGYPFNFVTDSSHFFHLISNNTGDSVFMVKHLRLINSNLVYLLGISPQKATAERLFHPDSLAARFIKP